MSAVEFALVAPLALLTIVFILTIGLILYLNQALDFAAGKAARQVMIGTIQTNAVNQSDFRTKYVCPYLPAALNCTNVIVNLQTITEDVQPNGYYTVINSSVTGLIIPQLSNASTQYSPGVQKSYEYLQVIYPVTFIPSFVANLMGGQTYNGSPAYLVVSTAAFRNEQY